MFRCYRTEVLKNKYKKSLSTHASYKKDTQFIHNGIPLCTGSMTLEAAVVLPVVACFLVSILFFFRVLQIESDMQVALSYAGRKSASFCVVTEEESAVLASAYGFWRAGLNHSERLEEYVDLGTFGVDFSESSAPEDGDEITLVAKYKINLPIALFNVDGIWVRQEQICKKWTGDSGEIEDEDNPYVYITKEGTVYHRSLDCHYLDLSIEAISYSNVGSMRNESEHKYYACDACAEDFTGFGMVYVTDYGERFHTSLNCIGLKRTIYMVPLSEVEGRGACSKCGR